VREELCQSQQQRNDPALEMPQRQYAPHLPNTSLNKIVPSLILGLLQDPLPQLRVPLECLANDFDGLEEVVRVVEINDFDQDVHPLLAVDPKQLEQFLLHLVDRHQFPLVYVQRLILLVVFDQFYQTLV
jgi:hypothetical protein